MVRPANFGFNPETAASNAFQKPEVGAARPDAARPGAARPSAVQEAAVREFDGLAEQLRRAGVVVIVAEDTASPVKPDAIFPNNWVSLHRDGTVVLYPLLAVNRRAERRDDILRLVREAGYRMSRTVDLRHREDEAQFLEGTGSLVLDRTHRIAYAALSPRTDLDVLGEFAQLLDYELATFEAFDATGKAVYHTNVMLAIGSRFAMLCGAAIDGDQHRAAVAERLRTTGHEVIDLSLQQMLKFVGNLLELAPPTGNVIALSTTAWNSLLPAQRRILERHGSVVAADIPVIERLGGGGVRCMLAEIHLPAASPATSRGLDTIT
jgi:hypothetical protein